MNVNLAGRGGVITSLFGFFAYIFGVIFFIGFCIFALAVGTLALIMGTTWNVLTSRRRARKEARSPRPVPAMSRVQPPK